MHEPRRPETASKIVEILTEPSRRIHSEEARQQARVLAALSLFLLVMVLMITPVWLLFMPPFPGSGLFALAMVLACGAAYALSRSQAYRGGAMVLIGMIFTLVPASLILEPQPLHDRMLVMMFLILAPQMAGAFLKPGWTLLAAGMSLGIIGYFYTIPGVPFEVTTTYLFFFLLVTALGMVGARMSDWQKQRTGRSEERYRSVVAALSEGVIILDQEGRIGAANHAAERILGLSAVELSGRDSGDERWGAVREDGRPFPREEHPAIRTLRSGAATQNVIMGVQGSQGDLRWISINSQPIFEEGQARPIAVVASFSDITERKRAEQALRDRENNLRTLFNSIADFLFVLDIEGNILEINETVRRRLGYADEELIGKPVLTVHPPGRREEAAQIVSEILAGRARYCPVPLFTADERLIPVETYVSHGLWNGQPALFAVTKDISDLKLSEEKFAAAFHANPALAGLSRVETGEYIEVNQTFCEKLGFTPEEVIGKRSTDLLKLDGEFREAVVHQLTHQGYVSNIETVLTGKDGRKLPVLLSARVLNFHGRVYNFTTAVDISDRRQAEQRAFELALEKERHRLLRQFIEAASHEFRTPLAIIQLMSSSMANMEDRAERKVKAERVDQQIQRIVKLVDSLLTLVKLDTETSLPLTSLRVAPLVAMACRRTQGSKGPRVSFHSEPDIPSVQGHAETLGEALNQLLDNARRFSSDEAEIQVRLERQGTGLRIEVQDQGPGISEDDLPNVFETFWRNDRAHSTPGFGLGLPIVRRIVELHGGTIEIESTAGQGTRVRIDLPGEEYGPVGEIEEASADR